MAKREKKRKRKAPAPKRLHGRFVSKATWNRSRGLKRYWRKVRKNARTFGVTIADARKLYRAEPLPPPEKRGRKGSIIWEGEAFAFGLRDTDGDAIEARLPGTPELYAASFRYIQGNRTMHENAETFEASGDVEHFWREYHGAVRRAMDEAGDWVDIEEAVDAQRKSPLADFSVEVTLIEVGNEGA